jgi:hypothetical protein
MGRPAGPSAAGTGAARHPQGHEPVANLRPARLSRFEGACPLREDLATSD